MTTTFKVDNVNIAQSPKKVSNAHELIGQKIKSNIEACSNIELISWNPKMNGLLAAAHIAFDEHRPLSLTPDAFWLTIANGLAKHINMNSETLRHNFVDHDGKETIIVKRDNFIKGDPSNNWEGCFEEFSNKLEAYIGKRRDLIVSSFSTTGKIEKAASQVILMDAMQSYFDYRLRTLCGFPSITLEGTIEDWKDIKSRVTYIGEFGLEWWTNHLLPVIDKVIDSVNGNVDIEFWRSFLKISGGSGGPHVSGWINTLFPYLDDNRKNYGIEYSKYLNRPFGGGPNPYNFPIGLSSVPFKWEYYDIVYNMRFVGGIIGVSQSKDLTVRPEAGWAITDNEG
jgi:hypothetical protein